MAGYWPRSLFAFWWTTLSQSIKTQTENLANIQPSWPHTWSMIYIYCTSKRVWIAYYYTSTFVLFAIFFLSLDLSLSVLSYHSSFLHLHLISTILNPLLPYFQRPYNIWQKRKEFCRGKQGKPTFHHCALVLVWRVFPQYLAVKYLMIDHHYWSEANCHDS